MLRALSLELLSFLPFSWAKRRRSSGDCRISSATLRGFSRSNELSRTPKLLYCQLVEGSAKDPLCVATHIVDGQDAVLLDLVASGELLHWPWVFAYLAIVPKRDIPKWYGLHTAPGGFARLSPLRPLFRRKDFSCLLLFSSGMPFEFELQETRIMKLEWWRNLSFGSKF